ncbi:MAG: glycosyltransferase family 1 protein [Bacteroidota bacterium]
MRIAFDAKRIFQNQTGLGNYSRTLVDNLRQYAPENDYLLFAPTITKNEQTKKYDKEFTTVAATTRFKHIWRSYSIRKDLEKANIDLYHGLSNEIPFWLKNTKTVVTIHDVIFKILPHTYPQLDRWLYEEKTRYACKYAHQIVAISEQTKADLVRFYNVDPDRIEVIYQPCQPIFYEENKTYTKLISPTIAHLPAEYLLYVGSIVERKNLLVILQAMARTKVAQRIPLVVVGKGKAYQQKMRQYIAKQQLANWVYWLDNLMDNTILKHLYHQAQVVIYPSHYEGFGLPIVEAMLCEAPVITSNVSALPEAAGRSALLFDPDDADALADLIQALLSDTNRRHSLGKLGRKEVLKRFHPKKLTEQMLRLYQLTIHK